jgi:hypothetical protein
MALSQQETLDALADQLIGMAQGLEDAVDKGTDKDNTPYSGVQKIDLLNKANQLRQKAASVRASAIIAISDSVSDSLAKLQGATTDINNALKTIATVQQVIDFAAEAVSFATTILSGNPEAIATGAAGLISKIPS